MEKYLVEFTSKRKSSPIRKYVVNVPDAKSITEWIERQKNALMVAWLKDSDLYDGQSPNTFKSVAVLLKKENKKYLDPRNDAVVCTK